MWSYFALAYLNLISDIVAKPSSNRHAARNAARGAQSAVQRAHRRRDCHGNASLSAGLSQPGGVLVAAPSKEWVRSGLGVG